MQGKATLVFTENTNKSVGPKELGLSVTQAPKLFGNLSVLETLRDGLVAVVLAAGSGTRFRADIPKVLYPLDGKPLVRHVTDAVHTTGSPVVVVVGHEGDRVRQALADTVCVFVEQVERLGTAHAVYLSRYALPSGFVGDIIVLYADVPGVDEALMNAIIDKHRSLRRSDPAYGAIVVTGSRSNSSASASSGYGRILRDERNPSCISQIVEKKQINLMSDSDPQKRILDELDEFNSGIFIARAPELFSALSDATPHQVGSERYEYYATDFVRQMVASGLHVYAWQVPPVIQYKIEGANTLEELEEIEMRRRAQRERDYEATEGASQRHLIDGTNSPTKLSEVTESVPCNRRD